MTGVVTLVAHNVVLFYASEPPKWWVLKTGTRFASSPIVPFL